MNGEGISFSWLIFLELITELLKAVARCWLLGYFEFIPIQFIYRGKNTRKLQYVPRRHN